MAADLASMATVVTIDRSDRSGLADALAAGDAQALCRRTGARCVIQGGYESLGAQIFVTASAEGFAPYTRTAALTQAATPTLDVTLGVLFRVEVEVPSSGLEISGRRNLSSRILTGRDIEALPSNPRLLRERLAAMAGHVGRPGDVTFLIDGFSSRFRFPPKGAIQMIRINANTFDAEFQEPGQQRIEIITKPSSSEFYGEVDVGFADESLYARDPFTVTKPPQQSRTFSSYLSGPLIPNRWGFLVYGGQWNLDENASVHATVLDPTTFAPRSVVTTVPTPSRSTSFTVQLDRLAGENNTLSLGYDQEKSTTQNLGLDSGFDLPERSYDSTSMDRAVRLSLTSIFEQAVNELRVQFSRNVAALGAGGAGARRVSRRRESGVAVATRLERRSGNWRRSHL